MLLAANQETPPRPEAGQGAWVGWVPARRTACEGDRRVGLPALLGTKQALGNPAPSVRTSREGENRPCSQRQDGDLNARNAPGVQETLH